MLKILGSTDLQDWQLKGNYNNFMTGLIICPDTYLLPFYYIGNLLPTNIGSPSTVSEFKVQQLSYSDLKKGTKTVVNTISLTTTLLTIGIGTNGYDRFYYKATSDPSFTGVDGYYQFYIKILQGATTYYFISDVFQYVANKCGDTVTGDFNDDFNDDFNN